MASVIVSTLYDDPNNNFAVSAILGYGSGRNSSLQNITVNHSSIVSHYYSSGLIGNLFQSHLVIMNASVHNSNFSSYVSGSASFIGFSGTATIEIDNSAVSCVRIVAPEDFGIVFGSQRDINNSIIVRNSFSAGDNYINNVKSQNCNQLMSSWSVTQC
ncbi:Hypothetical_protein [Hexamita inflata]|nr:Hypothetical protein HINF_LOCUS23714 [Hexamita inflata]